MPQVDLVMDALKHGATNSAEVSAWTDIDPKIASSYLTILSRKGVIRRRGQFQIRRGKWLFRYSLKPGSPRIRPVPLIIADTRRELRHWYQERKDLCEAKTALTKLRKHLASLKA